MKNLRLKNLTVLAVMTLVATITFLPMKASAAWRQSGNGSWSYTDGNTSVSGWKLIDGKWYFFDSNSVMKTGWINDGGTWYYMQPSGAMKTGWANDSGKWYYLQPSGAMKTGWALDNGAWYYLNSSGEMKTGLVDVNGKTYYLSESGAMKTGNITVNGISYTFAANGEKINSSTPNQAGSGTAAANTAASTTASSGGSGGSGGGAGSVGTGTNPVPSYESLYRTWTVGQYVASNGNLKLTADQISECENQNLTIKSDSITFYYYGANITAPITSISTGTMKPSDFYKKYKVTVSGDEVKYFTTHINISSLDISASATIYITDSQAYALLGGALFELN
jgi:hypothetical protein